MDLFHRVTSKGRFIINNHIIQDFDTFLLWSEFRTEMAAGTKENLYINYS